MLLESGVHGIYGRASSYTYGVVEFDILVGMNGGCYDRYLCRMEEL